MSGVEQQKNLEGRKDLESVIKELLKKHKTTIKGRIFGDRLQVLLATAFEEVLDKMKPEDRGSLEEQVVNVDLRKTIERQFTRVTAREYARLTRRPSMCALVEAPVATESEFSQQQELKEKREWVRHAVSQLPRELKEVMEFELERMSKGERAATPEEIRESIKIGRTIYLERRKRALARLKVLLLKDEAL